MQPSTTIHGLKQGDVRKIWFDLGEEYRDLGEVHFFSKIVKVGSDFNAIIEVTCTGSLSGLSKTSGLRVPIDSWYEEVHFLTLGACLTLPFVTRRMRCCQMRGRRPGKTGGVFAGIR